MKLKEDLIIIDAEKAKDKLYNLKAEIEKADGNLKAFLCDLFDIYMFQVFSGGMPRSTEESNTIPEGEDEMIHSDLTKKEWDELQAWRKEIKTEFKENLTEGSSWYEQVDKMKALEAGTRGFNAKAASNDKLRTNRQICQSYNLPTALDIVETEMVNRGLIPQTTKQAQKQAAAQPAPQPTPAPKQATSITFKVDDFHAADAIFVKNSENVTTVIADSDEASEGQTKVLLRALIFALILGKESNYIQALKLYLTDFCEYPAEEIKATINKCLANDEIISRLNLIKGEIESL